MTARNPNKIILHKTYAEILVEYLWYDFKVKISIEDVERVKVHKWHCTNFFQKGYKYKYIYTNINGKKIKLHRFITNCPDNMVVDHINHRTLDNRRCNLRVCTASENMQNLKRSKRNKSGYPNIHFTHNGYWRFQKEINGKNYSYSNKDINKVLDFKNKFVSNNCVAKMNYSLILLNFRLTQIYTNFIHFPFVF